MAYWWILMVAVLNHSMNSSIRHDSRPEVEFFVIVGKPM